MTPRTARTASSRGTTLALAAATLVSIGGAIVAGQPAASATGGALRFEAQEIRRDFGVGYALSIVDMNGDKKPDIVAINGTQLVWFENPSWTEHVLLDGQTEKDNVAIAPHDIDGDGRMDVALAAGWNPRNTTGGGTLQWVSQPASGTGAGTLPESTKAGAMFTILMLASSSRTEPVSPDDRVIRRIADSPASRV